LLHNDNDYPSIPVGHEGNIYYNMKQLLRCINYGQHQWQRCGDLKVAALLLSDWINKVIVIYQSYISVFWSSDSWTSSRQMSGTIFLVFYTIYMEVKM